MSPAARLTAVTGGVEFASSYDAALVDAFKKRIPYEARRWDGSRKVWVVQPEYARVCAELAQTYLGVEVPVPTHVLAARPETRLVELLYLARCKERDGASSAMGWSQGAWSVVFPEAVLRAWFQVGPTGSTRPDTLYGVLAIAPTATVDEVRSAHRRMARQWHPDLCHEDGAAERFKLIQRAYELLADPLTRRKYDAGLVLEASTHATRRERVADEYGYRAPLRCGLVLCEGVDRLGRFGVREIVQWEDLEDDQGRVMVTSWPAGADTFETRWQ